MNLFTILFSLFFLASSSTPKIVLKHNKPVEKIDISGHWEGTITRDEGGGRRTTYGMDLDINQKGKILTGISYVHFDNGTRQLGLLFDSTPSQRLLGA